MSQQIINYGAAANDGTGDPIRSAFSKIAANFAELYNLSERTGFTYVSALADLPTPVSGVITLTAGTYYFTQNVDLAGNRILCSGVVCLAGTSSETAGITSTGLVGVALITTTYSMPMRDLTITAPSGSTAISAVAGSSSYALDWRAVNFSNTASIGTISGYSNSIFSDGALLNSKGLTFDGSVGTIAFENYLFSADAGTIITLPASIVISRRFRIIYSSFVVTGTGTGLNVSASATIPTDSYILDTVNFSGGATYLTGVAYNDNKSRFTQCKGISNSSTIGYATMINNATATVVGGGAGTYTKMAGTFTLESVSQRFSLTSNKLKYTGTLDVIYEISVNASLTTTANNVVAIYVYKNGVQVANSESVATATAGGKAENVSAHTVLALTLNDEIDVYVENKTAGNNITGVNCALIAKPIPVG